MRRHRKRSSATRRPVLTIRVEMILISLLFLTLQLIVPIDRTIDEGGIIDKVEAIVS